MKDVLVAFLDFLKIPVGIILPYLLLKGKVKTFMLKDLISKKVLEIDAVKKKVRRKIENSAIDFNSFNPHDKVKKVDTEYAKDVLSEFMSLRFMPIGT
ncbi:hypothetical protein [Vreelandella sp. TE19]